MMKYILTVFLIVIITVLVSAVVLWLIGKRHPLKRWVKWIAGIVLTVALLGVDFLAYAAVYYHADDSVQQYLVSSDTVDVDRATDGWYFDGPGTENAIVFYPGAKVEETAYAPLLYQLAEDGVDCYLVKMPLRLAFLDADAAGRVISVNRHANWYLMGHSLGGSIGASYASEHQELSGITQESSGDTQGVSGVIFLASYSTSDLSVPVLSIYGSNDGVLNREEMEQNKAHLKGSLTETVIDGGNHSGFGDYGKQRHDGDATITAEEQQKQTADAIVKWISSQSEDPSQTAGGSKSKDVNAADTVSTAAADSTEETAAESSTEPDPRTCAEFTGYLQYMLDNFGADGYAGISLRASGCAAEIMNWYCTSKPSEDFLKEQSAAFVEKLSDDQKNSFQQAVRMVYDYARETVESGGKDLLSDAGYQGDIIWTKDDVNTCFESILAALDK